MNTRLIPPPSTLYLLSFLLLPKCQHSAVCTGIVWFGDNTDSLHSCRVLESWRARSATGDGQAGHWSVRVTNTPLSPLTQVCFSFHCWPLGVNRLQGVWYSPSRPSSEWPVTPPLLSAALVRTDPSAHLFPIMDHSYQFTSPQCKSLGRMSKQGWACTTISPFFSINVFFFFFPYLFFRIIPSSFCY